MPELYYIPAYIFPSPPITRLEIIPGVYIEKYSKKIGDKIKQKNEAWDLADKVGYSFKPNYNIKIVSKDYLNYQKIEAIKNFGEESYKKSIEKPEGSPDWIPETIIRPTMVARQAFLSLSLHKLVEFKYGGSFDFRSNLKVGGHANDPLQSSKLLGYVKSKKSVFNRKEIFTIGNAINIYFGPNIWHLDRLSIALSSLWASLCTGQIEQEL